MKRSIGLRYGIVILIIFSFIVTFTKCINNSNDTKLVNTKTSFSQFAGSESCSACHKDIFQKHARTAHALTAHSTVEKYLKGSFEPGMNIYPYGNSVAVAMEKRNDGFYQVAYENRVEKEAWRMDIIIGSATLGESYLSWKDHALYQLPITYFTAADRWSNSSGNEDQVVFNRSITSRCLECHNTFAKTISAPGVYPEQFDSTQIIYAVGCEKCHGPAAEHVKYHISNPNDQVAKFIVNPAHLTRQQNLDVCVLCHGGKLEKSVASFEFTPGDTLANYFKLDSLETNPSKIDVHGNQFALLRASKCFRLSSNLTCTTCHDSHENERGQVATFSQRCQSCHSSVHGNVCKLTSTMGTAINNNCIDCHMPVKPSNVVTVFLPHTNGPTAALIRTHFITIYPNESKKVMDTLKAVTRK